MVWITPEYGFSLPYNPVPFSIPRRVSSLPLSANTPEYTPIGDLNRSVDGLDVSEVIIRPTIRDKRLDDNNPDPPGRAHPSPTTTPLSAFPSPTLWPSSIEDQQIQADVRIVFRPSFHIISDCFNYYVCCLYRNDR